MSLTADEIKANGGANLKKGLQKVSTPEWGENGAAKAHVYVRSMSANSVGLMRRIKQLPLFAKDENTGGMVGWCVAFVCNDEGVLLFDESDCEWLANDNIEPVIRCCKAARSLNGSDKETAGNSETTQTGASP